MVGRGDLNPISMLLICRCFMDLDFLLEYQLEYDTPLDYLFAFVLTSPLRNHNWRELPKTASGERQILTGHRPEKETRGCAYETRGDSNRAEAVGSVSASGNRQWPK